MLEVRKLLQEIMQGPPERDVIHQQTVKIPELAHCKLKALAAYTKFTKSGLASRLLVAALEDALASLDEVPLGRQRYEDGTPVMVGAYLRALAESEHTEALARWRDAGAIPGEDDDEVLPVPSLNGLS